MINIIVKENHMKRENNNQCYNKRKAKKKDVSSDHLTLAKSQ